MNVWDWVAEDLQGNHSKEDLQRWASPGRQRGKKSQRKPWANAVRTQAWVAWARVSDVEKPKTPSDSR